MRKLLKQPWFVAVLVLSAIVFCTISLREQLGAGQPRIHSSGAVDLSASVPLEGGADDESALVRSDGSPRSIAAVLAALQFPTAIPDPFTRRRAHLVAGEPDAAPALVLPDEKDSIQLTAVWHQAGVRLALVNNRIVRAGDQLGRLTIDEITVDGIWVSHWKGRDFVAFGGEFTLLTPAEAAPAPSLALHEN